MDKKILIIISSLLIFSLMANGYMYITFVQNETNNTAQISAFEIEINSLKDEVSSLNSTVLTLSSEKESLENEKTIMKKQINSLNSSILILSSEKESLENDNADLTSQIISLENEVRENYNIGFDEGKSEGYLEGVIDGAGTGYNIRDPTYEEALSFVYSDLTNLNTYVDGEYVCWNYVADFKNNAFNAGYRAGDVYVEFPESAHAITCFNTTDMGLIFIEPQEDEIVTLTIGQPYWDREIYYAPDYDDTIINYAIIW